MKKNRHLSYVYYKVYLKNNNVSTILLILLYFLESGQKTTSRPRKLSYSVYLLFVYVYKRV